MISFKNNIKAGGLALVTAMAMLTSCNKDLEQFPNPVEVVPGGKTIAEELLSRPNDTLFYRLLERGGLIPTLSNNATRYTVFVADSNAMKVFVNAASSGAVPLTAPGSVFSNFIRNSLPVATATAIANYDVVPQLVNYATVPSTFPNFQYPSLYNPAPTVSALLRLTVFPTTRNGNYVNNIPVTNPNIVVAAGILHEVPALVAPPSKYLWDRINADAGLTYLKAAIIRADSGTAAPGTLQGALLNIGANLTVYAPTDAAFQATLTGAIAQGLIAQGVPPATALAQATALAASPAVFTNPALYGVLTATVVKGIVVYHILGNRAFNNNLPTVQANFPTLLNSAVPTHPGIGLKSTFTGLSVSAATAKGAANATASNILINPTPEPNGTSDQHYLNGVLHKIDQVLLPQ
ncbi:MAG: hypothetical protein JWQ27_2217 [Ferruginibacter sp.]|nr:hypothetical protein [Ferruginibacter sp.]